MQRFAMIAALLGAALAGCAGGSKPAPPSRLPSRPVAADPPRRNTAAVPQVMAPAGLEGVIGSPAAALTRRFGQPRIDLTEGDARKLQFAGRACVLDIYLYPVSAAAVEPTATHVAARLRQGGAPADPGGCIRQIERR